MAIEYTQLSPERRLVILRDRLEGLEADHYRLVVTKGTEGASLAEDERRQGELEQRIQFAQQELQALEAELNQ
jgi:ABC-type phosphate transport system auxiliary subunit